MRLVPIDVDTPQDELAKKIATTLAKEGIDGGFALPMAIGIMADIQRSIEASPAKISDAEALAIVHEHVTPSISTLETRKRDSLDFHEVSVGGLRRLINAAFNMGMARTKH